MVLLWDPVGSLWKINNEYLNAGRYAHRSFIKMINCQADVRFLSKELSHLQATKVNPFAMQPILPVTFDLIGFF